MSGEKNEGFITALVFIFLCLTISFISCHNIVPKDGFCHFYSSYHIHACSSVHFPHQFGFDELSDAIKRPI